MGPGTQPDICPQRLSAVDVASLTHVETRAILVLLAGHPDPVVSGAVVDSVQRVLDRTRVSAADSAVLDHLAMTPDASAAEVTALQAAWLSMRAR